MIQSHGINFHCYADDTQLYLSMKPEETEPLAKLQGCFKDIKTWMPSNLLLLNLVKTELIVFGPKHLRNRLTVFTLVIFDQDMSFKQHFDQPFFTSNITKIRSILSQGDAEKLIHEFVTSRLDYCNALFAGCPKNLLNNLQLIQNEAVSTDRNPQARSCLSCVNLPLTAKLVVIYQT